MRRRPPVHLGGLTAVVVAVALTGCGHPAPSTSPSSTVPAPTAPSLSVPASTLPNLPTTTSTTTQVVTSTTTAPLISSGATLCAATQLSIVVQPPLGSAGAEHYLIVMRNVSTLACTLFGFPGVSFLDSGGHQIGPPADRATTVVPSLVGLAPGDRAYVNLDVTDQGIPPCAGPGAVWRVRVFPPGSTEDILVAPPANTTVCTSENTSTYTASTVSPVSAVAGR